ncbi:hypothetical protein [Shewanella colwelliana]|uniref:hypothetical protein n=1 Tax=Shewanella colwelliana TaxID=23 RepID=UPI0037362137
MLNSVLKERPSPSEFHEFEVDKAIVNDPTIKIISGSRLLALLAPVDSVSTLSKVLNETC